MLYKNTKAMVSLPKRDADFFDNVPGILLGDTLETYLFVKAFCNLLEALCKHLYFIVLN